MLESAIVKLILLGCMLCVFTADPSSISHQIFLGPLVIPAIAAGSTILGQGIGAASQGAVNRKTRNYNVRMYQRQRADALADWAMQNEYNHPSSQMARLREAGLNPHLVYGNGATTEGGSVRQSTAESWNPRAPQFDVGQAAGVGIATYYDAQVKQAQIDNLREQNTVLEKESSLKAAQTIATLMGSKNVETDIMTKEFNLALEKSLRDYTVEGRKLDVVKKQSEIANVVAQTKLTLTHDEIQQLMKKPNMEKVLQEVINLKRDQWLKESGIALNTIQGQKMMAEIREVYQRISNMAADGALKQFDLWLKGERGKMSDAPGFIRVINDIIKQMFEGSTPSPITK